MLHRAVGVGWVIASGDGAITAIHDDGGTTLPIAAELVGTREAARLVGVRPPNFVRDWAGDPAFPAPVARLACGRVWRASDVIDFVATRRAPWATDARLASIARRLVWWQGPERTLAHPLDFIARVMARGTVDEVREVRGRYGDALVREAYDHAAPGVFDDRAWRYWALVLGRDPDGSPPRRAAG